MADVPLPICILGKQSTITISVRICPRLDLDRTRWAYPVTAARPGVESKTPPGISIKPTRIKQAACPRFPSNRNSRYPHTTRKVQSTGNRTSEDDGAPPCHISTHSGWNRRSRLHRCGILELIGASTQSASHSTGAGTSVSNASQHNAMDQKQMLLSESKCSFFSQTSGISSCRMY